MGQRASMHREALGRERPARPRGNSMGMVPWLLGGAILAFVALAVVVVVVIIVVRQRAKNEQTNVAAAATNPATANGAGTGPAKPTAGAYVPGVSEKKLEELIRRYRVERGEEGELQVTDQEVLAAMGPPTSSEPPVTVNRNGQTLTVWKARWDHVAPDHERHTVMAFANGKFAGGVINAVTTYPNGKGGSGPARPPEQPPPPPITRQTKLSRPVADLLVGSWEADVPPINQPNPARVRKLRLEFRADGTCSTAETGEAGKPVASTNGKWRVDRAEANNLWFNFDLKNALAAQSMSIGNPVLATFAGDDEWETRGVLPGTVCTFRRVR
jgi:hypothetical protein